MTTVRTADPRCLHDVQPNCARSSRCKKLGCRDPGGTGNLLFFRAKSLLSPRIICLLSLLSRKEPSVSGNPGIWPSISSFAPGAFCRRESEKHHLPSSSVNPRSLLPSQPALRLIPMQEERGQESESGVQRTSLRRIPVQERGRLQGFTGGPAAWAAVRAVCWALL